MFYLYNYINNNIKKLTSKNEISFCLKLLIIINRKKKVLLRTVFVKHLKVVVLTLNQRTPNL